ncbi:OmpP1/FadL family transporter [Paraburkholderia aspalathi]|uniref:OmpP1/FadL family transporter n=1 Tax=Paraburkholderia aspalathi TaxID=1324617 RepID=UPI001B14006A|nr:outer membrane protein transport protein [Paraburkholderia aspalathi]CAE6848469.1 hypothetical protein R20943_07454 [Paraburkholderia aspalathi]
MKSNNVFAAVRGLMGLSVALSTMTNANATDVFNLEGYGPISRAMGGTGVAYNVGTAAMMENPATLGLMEEGSYFELGADVINPDIRAIDKNTGESVLSKNHGNNNGPYFAPELAYVYRHKDYAFGIGAFAGGGLGTQFGGSSFLSRTTTNNIDTGLDNFSRLLVLRIPFSIAYKVTDKLTLGGSVDAVWTSLNLGLLLDTSQIGNLASQGRINGSLVPTLLGVPGLSGGYFNFSHSGIVGGGASAWGIGGKLGLTYQIAPDTRLGVAYNFKTDVGDLSGGANLTAVSSVAGNIPLSGRIVVRDFQMPAQLSIGINHKFSDQLSVSLEYQRVFWADAFKNINVGFVQNGTGANLNVLLPQNYRDINVFALGAEYRYNDKWTFRGGAQYAQEAIPNNTLLTIAPAIPTTHLSGGVSYAFNKDNVLAFAMSVGLQKTVSNDSQPNTAVPIKVTHSQVNLLLNYQRRF